MNVRKVEQTSNPGYPSLGQFAKSVRQLGLAAVGAGAVGTACAAENARPPLSGVLPVPSNRVESASTTESQPPRLPGDIRSPHPPVRLAGKIAVEPLGQPVTTNAAYRASYVVKPGDTLTSIATRLLGSGNEWREIAKLNPTVDPDKLKVGQRLVLPSAAGKGAQ